MTNPSRFSTLKVLLFAWLFICILGGIETSLIYIFKPEVIKADKMFWLPLMRIVNGFVAISIVLLPGHKYLKPKSWSTRIIGYFFLMLAFTLAYLSVSVFQFQLAFMTIRLELFLAGIGETLMTDLHHIASYYLFLLFIILGKEYFEERTEALVKKEQLENELNKTQLEVLQRQIQPHFLFNTLNNVVAIIDERKDAAQEMLVDLSELLRVSMEMDFSKKIPLSKEMEILSTYLSIEKKRYEHQLEFELNFMGCEDVLVPPFLLQPMAENAIKHGFKGGIDKLHIQINAAIKDDFLTIMVCNDGTSLENLHFGLGLKNSEERLSNAYGNNYTFKLIQEKNLVVNEIKIPVE